MPPQNQARPSPSRAPGPRPSHGPKPSGSAPLSEKTTEVFFILLVVLMIVAGLANATRSPLFRSVYVQLFHPTSLTYYQSAKGARVYVSGPLGNVRESPGGVRIGSQESGSAGVIIGGAQASGATRFWDIDFDSGVDGWVDEAELLLFKQETVLSFILAGIADLFKIVSTLASLLFLSGIIYSLIRVSQVVAERRKHEKFKETPAHMVAAAQEHVNHRWERIIAHVQSENPADWRLAILEADIMLAEMLDPMGYIGENVGEKLKRVERSDFDTIEDAWEAHKIRNLVAHKGSDFVLSKREAQRVVSLYANVFREFHYI